MVTLKMIEGIGLDIKNIENNPVESRQYLEKMGYKYFPQEDVGVQHVKNVYFHAIYVTSTRKFNLVKDELDTIKRELCSLLGIENIKCFLKTDSLEALRKAKSPLDFADKLNGSTDSKIKLIEKLIQHQFEIRWNTKSGDPEDFTYSKFCAKAGSRDLLHYSPRDAQVKVQLYKEFLKHGLKKPSDSGELCPAIYMQDQAGGWKQWTWGENKGKHSNQQVFQTIENIETELEWMQGPIFKAVKQNLDKNNGELSQSLTKPSVYWAVINDNDFLAGPPLDLNKVGKSQVYIGETKNGIRKRWFTDGKNHGNCIMDSLNDKPSPTNAQLVHARLALAYFREENRALFLMNTSDNKESVQEEQNRQIEGFTTKDGGKKHIVPLPPEKGQWRSRDMEYGLNCIGSRSMSKPETEKPKKT